MTLIDGMKGDNQICVSYKNQFDVINEKNGDTLQLHQVEAKTVNVVGAVDIYDDDEPELLLSYNRKSTMGVMMPGYCFCLVPFEDYKTRMH